LFTSSRIRPCVLSRLLQENDQCGRSFFLLFRPYHAFQSRIKLDDAARSERFVSSSKTGVSIRRRMASRATRARRRRNVGIQFAIIEQQIAQPTAAAVLVCWSRSSADKIAAEQIRRDQFAHSPVVLCKARPNASLVTECSRNPAIQKCAQLALRSCLRKNTTESARPPARDCFASIGNPRTVIQDPAPPAAALQNATLLTSWKLRQNRDQAGLLLGDQPTQSQIWIRSL